MWMNTTLVNGVLKYSPTEKTDSEVIRILAQVSFLRQSGEDITLNIYQENPATHEVTGYEIIRMATTDGRLITNRIVKVD